LTNYLGKSAMTDYTITNGGSVTGTAGSDRLTYNINVLGGVVLTGMTGSLAAGYSGEFNGPGTNDGNFTGIEHFTFNDQAGGDDDITTLGGEDVLNGGDGNDRLNAGDGDDRLNAGDGDDTVFGGADNDQINAGSGSDFVGAGAGDDTITIEVGGDDTVNGAAGFDRVEIIGGNTAFTMNATSLSSGAASMTFSDIEAFEVEGSSQGDNITTGDERDIIRGNDGDDVMRGGGGLDSLFGGDGNDTIFGGQGASYINGGDGDDRITADDGLDTLFGGSGDDTIIGAKGLDLIYGGGGLDLWVADLTGSPLRVRLDANQTDTDVRGFFFQGTGVVWDVEGFQLTTGSGSDTLVTHKLYAMDDILRSGAGNDFLTVWMRGDDQVFGGRGEDRLTLRATDAVNGVQLTLTTLDGRLGYTGEGTHGTNTIELVGINSLTFYGDGGNDRIVTATRADQLFGGGGNDLLNAGGASDRIKGGDGNDTLVGADGVDFLYGGSDADVFAFAKNGDQGTDFIADFQDGVDLIRINGSSMANVKKAAANGGEDTRITLTNGTEILLEGVTKNLINEDDFLFS
jgi:Ca2+-binding RTX toxin-like protein